MYTRCTMVIEFDFMRPLGSSGFEIAQRPNLHHIVTSEISGCIVHAFEGGCSRPWTRVLYEDLRWAQQTVEQEETERFAVILQPGLQIGIFCSFLVNTAVILHSFQKSRGPSQVEPTSWDIAESKKIPGLYSKSPVFSCFSRKWGQ